MIEEGVPYYKACTAVGVNRNNFYPHLSKQQILELSLARVSGQVYARNIRESLPPDSKSRTQSRAQEPRSIVIERPGKDEAVYDHSDNYFGFEPNEELIIDSTPPKSRVSKKNKEPIIDFAPPKPKPKVEKPIPDVIRAVKKTLTDIGWVIEDEDYADKVYKEQQALKATTGYIGMNPVIKIALANTCDLKQSLRLGGILEEPIN